jgi:hypothetical protein
MSQRVALVPGVPALLPVYASLDDPVAELRAACRGAVAQIVTPGAGVLVVADAPGRRVAEALLAEVGARVVEGSSYDAVLVVGNGSARRRDDAPGHLDDRAAAFDDDLGEALRVTDLNALGTLDRGLAADLLADVTGPAALPDHLSPDATAQVLYADDPFGVMCWVVVWGPE